MVPDLSWFPTDEQILFNKYLSLQKVEMPFSFLFLALINALKSQQNV